MRSFRKKITEEYIGQEEYIGLLPSDLREITNLFRDNPAKLFVYIINEVMYDTERKQKYLQAIEEWKSQLIKFC